MQDVQGEVAPGFDRVRDAFVRNFAKSSEVGAACAAYVGGRCVVDLWGGTADIATGRPWDRDTMALFFSTTKGLTAMAAHRLVERGELDLDAPVACYWPEFAAEGKGAIPVRYLLNHQAGLAAVDATMPLDDVLAWDPVVDALAAQPPNWPPGSAHGYHALTFGWLIGEVVRRITGESLGTFFRREIAAPLGLDLWIGLPTSEAGRVAPLVDQDIPDDMRAMIEQFMQSQTLLTRALLGPSGALGETVASAGEVYNRADVHAAEIPAANGIGTARSLARLYGSLVADVDGIRTLSPETVAAARATSSHGPDLVLIVVTHFGLGFMLPEQFSPLGGPASFGHPGAGGSVAFADPDASLGFGYVPNQMQLNLAGDPRAARLVRAVYQSLAENG
jgi:CubicO group peptidase (beta-lactamase class C family)